MAEAAASPVEALPSFISATANGVNNDDVTAASATRPHTAATTPKQLPLDVRIDVKGAFIINSEEGLSTPAEELGGGGMPSWQQELGDLELDDPEDYQHDSNDIRLPQNRSVVSHMAVDIGGSLIKLCYWSFKEDTQDLGGRLNFRKFPTDRIDACIEFMKRLALKHKQQSGNLHDTNPVQELGAQGKNGTAIQDDDEDGDEYDKVYVVATGGGAYKFYDQIKEALGVEVMREDEMECLIIGLDFFISQVQGEVFTYSDTTASGPPAAPLPSSTASNLASVPSGSHKYPYLLVNIGSGVSMIKISGPREFERVGGTSLGGGTLWGLLSLLTGARNFDEMLRLAERGDNTAVDMLVGDIYGAGYGKIGLKSTTIASSFGKVYRTKRQAEREAEDHGGMGGGRGEFDGGSGGLGANMPDSDGVNGGVSGAARHVSFRPEDISKSLLYAISNNIGQIAYLHAEKHNCENIYFGGSFIGGHWQTMATLSYAIKFWSTGNKHAYFLRHEGYLGAVGAFLRRQPVDWSAGRRASFDGLFPLSRGPSKA